MHRWLWRPESLNLAKNDQSRKLKQQIGTAITAAYKKGIETIDIGFSEVVCGEHAYHVHNTLEKIEFPKRVEKAYSMIRGFFRYNQYEP